MNSSGRNGESSTPPAASLSASKPARRVNRSPWPPVADLVVILGTDNKLFGRASRGELPWRLAEKRILARIGITLSQHLGQQPGPVDKIQVIAVPLASQQHMQAMVQIVAPLRVEAVAASRLGGDVAGVVEVALGNQIKAPVQSLRLPMSGAGEVLQERHGREIENRVHGVQPQRIQVKFRLPVAGRSR